ncbi:MAG: hypothetical protein E7012_03435 [Alphaproteobacteria bacterium]|nr:hypothetical protein [Alphaproteobacteria bacterium]
MDIGIINEKQVVGDVVTAIVETPDGDKKIFASLTSVVSCHVFSDLEEVEIGAKIKFLTLGEGDEDGNGEELIHIILL